MSIITGCYCCTGLSQKEIEDLMGEVKNLRPKDVALICRLRGLMKIVSHSRVFLE